MHLVHGIHVETFIAPPLSLTIHEFLYVEEEENKNKKKVV